MFAVPPRTVSITDVFRGGAVVRSNLHTRCTEYTTRQEGNRLLVVIRLVLLRAIIIFSCRWMLLLTLESRMSYTTRKADRFAETTYRFFDVF